MGSEVLASIITAVTTLAVSVVGGTLVYFRVLSKSKLETSQKLIQDAIRGRDAQQRAIDEAAAQIRDEIREDRDQYKRERDKARAELDEIRRERHKLASELRESRNHNERLREQLDERDRQIHALKHYIADLEGLDSPSDVEIEDA